MKNILVTGATDGIGLQTALVLSQNEHNIFVHGRTKEKAEKAISSIKKKYDKAKLKPVFGDLGSFEQIHGLAQQILNLDSPLDVLINNAGVYMTERVLSEEGFEMTFAINHLAPFLLTNLLLEKLEQSSAGRVVTVSSIAHARGEIKFDNLNSEKKFDAYGAYANSKLCNVLFSNELARRKPTLACNSLHPGVITTKLLLKGFNTKGDSVEKGAETSVYLAEKAEQKITGKYFSNMKIVEASPQAMDFSIGEKLWLRSIALCGL